jgi:hypothetical protein
MEEKKGCLFSIEEKKGCLFSIDPSVTIKIIYSKTEPE